MTVNLRLEPGQPKPRAHLLVDYRIVEVKNTNKEHERIVKDIDLRLKDDFYDKKTLWRDEIDYRKIRNQYYGFVPNKPRSKVAQSLQPTSVPDLMVESLEAEATSKRLQKKHSQAKNKEASEDRLNNKILRSMLFNSLDGNDRIEKIKHADTVVEKDKEPKFKLTSNSQFFSKRKFAMQGMARQTPSNPSFSPVVIQLESKRIELQNTARSKKNVLLQKVQENETFENKKKDKLKQTMEKQLPFRIKLNSFEESKLSNLGSKTTKTKQNPRRLETESEPLLRGVKKDHRNTSSKEQASERMLTRNSSEITGGTSKLSSMLRSHLQHMRGGKDVREGSHTVREEKDMLKQLMDIRIVLRNRQFEKRKEDLTVVADVVHHMHGMNQYHL